MHLHAVACLGAGLGGLAGSACEKGRASDAGVIDDVGGARFRDRWSSWVIAGAGGEAGLPSVAFAPFEIPSCPKATPTSNTHTRRGDGHVPPWLFTYGNPC